MKRIRKIFMILFVATAIMSLLAVYAFAEGEISPDNANEDVSASESTGTEETPAESKNSASEGVTVWDRISEYLTGDKLSQTVTFAYNIFCTVLLILMKRSTTTSSADLLKIITANSKSSKEKMNELADVYNANEKEVEALKQEFSRFREENKIQTVTSEQFTAALEGIRDIGNVLKTIYQNSSTVPAVIKTTVIKEINKLNDTIDEAEKSTRKDV